jgi:DNA polymerase-3 subunit gamma/tau
MAYTALYRKYRPTNFSSIVGQDVIVDILKNSIINNKVSHAYLFTGPRGTGKTSTAKILAHAVNCLNFTNDICGECSICKSLDLNDNDIVEIDAASNNGVDEIRSLRDNVNLMPAFCKYKIYIIDEVHMLSTGAFNALLKTLEEPPSHVIFILATTEPNKIPLTILSRCQRFDFNKINMNDLVSRLKYIVNEEGRVVSDNILEQIAKISDGGLRDAINLLDQVLSLPDENINIDEVEKLSGKISTQSVYELFSYIINNDLVSILNFSTYMFDNGKNYKDLADSMLSFLRDISINTEVPNYFDKSYSELLSKITISFNNLIKMSSIINELLKELKNSNNQKMLFEIYVFQMCNILNCVDKVEVINTSMNNKKNVNIKNDKNENINIETKQNLIDSDLKDIRINNVFSGANKEILNSVNSKYYLINDYISNKKYNMVSILLSSGRIVVASDKYLLFSFKNKSDVLKFDSIYKQIEQFLKKIYDESYKIVAVSDKEWEEMKNNYINNIKNKISYVFIEENDVKLEMSENSNALENSALNIFGEDTISVK